MTVRKLGRDAIAIFYFSGFPETGELGVSACLSRFDGAMKNSYRLLLGVLSGLLLWAGFANAANRLDPLTNHLNAASSQAPSGTAPDCGSYCDVLDSTD